MLTLYLAAFSSFWFQCTRSGETAVPARWHSAQFALGMSVGLPPAPRIARAKSVCVVSKLDPVPVTWQVKDDSVAARVFQVSPCGVFGFAPVWQTVQLRTSCAKPTSDSSCLAAWTPQIV